MAVSQIDPNGLNVGQLGSRNLVTNGAMGIAQRGTSSTTNGYGSVDRFQTLYNGTDEAPTQAQVDVASGTTPYTLGFRKALKITNGNQTSGAGAADYLAIYNKIEGQDISSSGWSVTDPDSKLTLSYWVKSSVAQTFYGRFRAFASSQYEYTYSFALSANTWTKVTKTIIGNSNFSSLLNTNALGFFHNWQCFFGTDYTNNKTLDEWAVKDNANKSPDMTSTWYTTNDATFEITGVQLEVSPTGEATPFEHENYGTTLAKCQRYYERLNGPAGWYNAHGYATNIYLVIEWKVPKRTASGSVYYSNTNFASMITAYGNTGGSSAIDGVITGVSTSIMGVTALGLDVALSASTYTPFGSSVMYRLDASHWIAYDAEL